MPVHHVYIFFGKMSIQAFCPFFNQVECFWILSCMNSLHILDNHTLSVMSFANIFCNFTYCLFILSIISFAVQKLLSLTSSHLFTFAFVSFALGGRSVKYCYDYVKDCSTRRFIVSSLTFRSLIHFEFIFVCGKGNILIPFFTCTESVSLALHTGETVISPFNILTPFVRD